MKFSQQVFAIGLFAVAITLASGAQTENKVKEAEVRGIIDNLVNSTINSLLANLTEPIAVDAVALNFTSDALKGEANISSFQLSGIKELVATYIDVSVLTMNMNATILVPSLKLNTKYYADVVLASLIPLYGSGQIGVTLENTKINVSGHVNITGGLTVTNVTIVITLEDAVFDLHGLLDNEELSVLISEILNDTLVDFMNEYKDLISDIISPIVNALINSILGSSESYDEFLEVAEALDAINTIG